MSNRRHAGQTKDGKKSKSLSITSKSAWEGLQPLEPRLLLSAIANEAAYDRWICIESSASTDVQATANVLATQLEDMTGSEFNIETTKTTGRGIFLVRAAEDLATRYPDLVSQQSDLDTLETKTTEGFFIYSAAGSGSLYIVGNSDEALSLGAYYYLHQLGWDALLPGEDWTIKPQLSSITVSIDSLQDPAFIQRIFGGSGGMGGPLDPTKQLEADWILWKQENLFGGPATDGHAWQVFAADKKTELEEHPEYAAFDVYIGPDDPGNHHVPWSEDMKFDLSNQGLLDLFAAWAVSKYNPVTYPIVSIEPTDLSDFCVCPDCKANYQYDQDSTPIFHLAQVVADALKTAYPNDNPMINLYAYNTHAAVPYDQDLQDWLADPDSNIWVGVAPNGYQSTNLTADELAAAWAQAKPANLGLYD